MACMTKAIGSGALFSDDSHKIFMTLTGSRYEAMDNRMEKKKLPPLPFSKAQFRSHILQLMGGKEDGFIRCRYCLAHFGIKDIAADHAMPLARGGSPGLDNLEYPCKPCNARKGTMNPSEFLALLAFLETIPFARIDILKRLEISVQLAAGQRSTAAVVGKLKSSGAWKAAQKDVLAARKAKESGKR